ncbi:MAG TPA: 16S rRNA (uracil(1498)-N(3))-methyltransferase [Rectinemataceae bacterium]|nr:16S rRNA (uracil(1498)-N(3))-methyltransferase [Rectinemataceae bacterium]
MRQFVLPEDWDGGPECLIRGGRARYLTRILRLKEGDSFVGMDGAGIRWLCSVQGGSGGADLLRLKVEPLPPGGTEPELHDLRGDRRRAGAPGRRSAAADLSPESEAGALDGAAEAWTPPHLTLVQGLPKGAKMDLIVRQAVEAGVSRIVPLVSRHCVPQSSRDAAGRRARWERIAREALQQSGSAVPTRVEAAVDLAGLIPLLEATAPAQGELRLLLHEAPLAQASLHGYLTETPSRIVLCVGPEGGFAEDEVSFLRRAGFRPLRLAGAILRTETAAIVAVASVNIILSERSLWMPKPL